MYPHSHSITQANRSDEHPNPCAYVQTGQGCVGLACVAPLPPYSSVLLSISCRKARRALHRGHLHFGADWPPNCSGMCFVHWPRGGPLPGAILLLHVPPRDVFCIYCHTDTQSLRPFVLVRSTQRIALRLQALPRLLPCRACGACQRSNPL